MIFEYGGWHIVKIGFDEQGFTLYLKHIFDGHEIEFLENLVKNVIQYGYRYMNSSENQLTYWLSDIIPIVTFGEVAMFVDDCMLNEYGIKEKELAIAQKSA